MTKNRHLKTFNIRKWLSSQSRYTLSLLKVVFSFFIYIRLFLESVVVEFTTCGKMNGCFGTGALYTTEDNVNLQLYTDFSRSNHCGTEWKRRTKWGWCYITWYRTRAEHWWWHTERYRFLQLLMVYHQKAFNI